MLCFSVLFEYNTVSALTHFQICLPKSTLKGNNMKKNLVAIVLVMVLLAFGLSACQSKGTPKAGDEAIGTYTFFASNEGKGYVSNGTMIELFGEEIGGLFGKYTVTLKEGGKGTLFMDEDLDISWSRKGSVVTLKDDVESLECEYKSGVLVIDLVELKLAFAKEGADTSHIKLLSQEEARKALE